MAGDDEGVDGQDLGIVLGIPSVECDVLQVQLAAKVHSGHNVSINVSIQPSLNAEQRAEGTY